MISISSREAALRLYEAGRSAMSKGDLKEAIGQFVESQRAAPHFKTLELLGECLLRKGEYPEAVIYLAAAAGLGTNQYRPRLLLAQALSALGEKDEAIDKLGEALTINPDYKGAKDLLEELRGERAGAEDTSSSG